MAGIYFSHNNIVGNAIRPGGCCPPENPDCDCEIVTLTTPVTPGTGGAYFDITATAGGCAVPLTFQIYNLANPPGFPPVLQTTVLTNGAHILGSLPAGSYRIVVTDRLGCSDEFYFNNPLPPLAIVVNCNPPRTVFGVDGSVSVVASGGAPPYTYLWNTGQTTAVVTGLGVSTITYSVTVTDSFGNTIVGVAACNFDIPAVLDFCVCIDNTINLLVTNRILTVTNVTGHPAPSGWEYSLDGIGWQPANTFVITDAMVSAPGTTFTVYVRAVGFVSSTTTKTIYVTKAPFVFDNALEFDGVNDHITTDALIGLGMPKSGTIVVWFKNGETPTLAGVFEGANTAFGYTRGMLWVGDSNPSVGLNLQLNDNVIQARAGATVLQKVIKPPYLDAQFRGGWFFAAFVWDNNAVRLYVGDASSANWLTPATGVTSYGFGAYNQFSWGARGFGLVNFPAPFYGFMDDVRYFDRALDECELRCLFNDGKGNSMLDTDPNLRVYYKLDETGGNTATNSGNLGAGANGLLRGFSGVNGGSDSSWRTANLTNEAWRPHAATPIGVEYPFLNFLKQAETVDTKFDIAPGDSFSILCELEINHPGPPVTPLTSALLGVFRPTNSQMHGQSISNLELVVNGIVPAQCGIFDARFDEATSTLTVQIANKNDILSTSLTAVLTNWENRKTALAFCVDGAAETIKVYYNDGSGSALVIDDSYDTAGTYGGYQWKVSGDFGGRLLFGTPCPYQTDFDPLFNCGAEGLVSQHLKLFDLHLYRDELNQTDFDNWFNEVLGIDANHVRNERTVLPYADPRRFRCLLDTLNPTNLTETAQGIHGDLNTSVVTLWLITPIGPPTSPCADPTNYLATFNPPPPGANGWTVARHLVNRTAFLID